MTKIKQAADCATAAGLVATFGYDALGRRITRTANNGAPAVTTSTTAYDSAGRLTTLAHNLDGGSAANDNTYSFTWNPASQVASRATANDTVYAWTNHYNVTRAYVSNGLNQYTASGPRTLGYDANPALSDAAGGVEGGNLTSDNIWAYGYDAENKLVSAAGPQAVTLHYDAQGRLYKTIGAATTQFLYDGDALVAEYSGTGALLRRYVHGPGVDEPVLWYEGTGSATRRFFHADAQGSVVAVSDTTGLASEIHSYGPWGEPEGTTGSRFRYTGQIIIPELGMYHYKARMYSPWLGRFLQTDPIGYKDDNNLYAYTGNDPGNKTDPFGLETTCETKGGKKKTDGTIEQTLDMSMNCTFTRRRSDTVSARMFVQPPKLPDGNETEDEKPQSSEVRSKRQICNALGRSKYDVRKAWKVANTARKLTTNGKTNWNNPFLRESENWLTAASDYFTLPFAKTAQIYIHQYQKTLPFSDTTPFSQEALDAGLDGLSHLGDTPEELEDWCNGK